MSLSQVWLLTEFDMTEYRFTWDICNECGMLTEDAYSSMQLATEVQILNVQHVSWDKQHDKNKVGNLHPTTKILLLVDSSSRL